MPSQVNTLPLTRRLLGRYLMCGLACLFVCLALSLTFAWRGELIRLAPLTVIVPLMILVMGGVILRRTIWLNAQIEDQLRRIATVSSSAELALQPITDPELAAVGWNIILERVASTVTLASLESRLSESLTGLKQRKFEQILNSMPDGVAVTDAEGRVILANNALAALLKGETDESPPIGLCMEKLLALSTAKDAETLEQKLRQTSHAAVFDLKHSDDTSDGVLRISRYPLVDQDGSGTEHLWSVRDVTQQRLAEEMRNQFVITATHELRTPLSNIKAYAETLAVHEDIDVEQQREFYNTIIAEATRLSRFVDELLNVNQMEAGAMSLAQHETDLERLLADVIEHVQPNMIEKRINFEALIPAKLPKLHVDKDKIIASLVNLLGNAAKYTPDEGRVRLHVDVGKNQIQFHVEDSGIGIAEDELPKVFEKFFRSADERVRENPGSGLGLAFTHEVARLHGGTVVVHSELNKGSKFTMTLPI